LDWLVCGYLLPNLIGYKCLDESNAAVEYDPMDLIHFIKKNFLPLNLMMEHELSAITGATPTGRPRRAGSRCCSTEAK
jgi:hypothetical protein